MFKNVWAMTYTAATVHLEKFRKQINNKLQISRDF